MVTCLSVPEPVPGAPIAGSFIGPASYWECGQSHCFIGPSWAKAVSANIVA